MLRCLYEVKITYLLIQLNSVCFFSFDIYRKVPKDLTQPTTTGAVISICSIMFITFLVLSEAISFLSTEL